MRVEKLNVIKSTIKPTHHPYLTGAWTPIYDEVVATDMQVLVGTIPTDIHGAYFRNTENPIHEPIGRYHPFDGDAMLHMIKFHHGQAEYRNKFVRTKGMQAEAKAGKALWTGLAGNPRKSVQPPTLNGNKAGAHGYLKDAASTDVVVHAGHVLALNYQCGDAYKVCPHTLETVGTAAWVGPQGVSAHAKVDLHNGQLLFFNYSKTAPYLHYGVVGPDEKLVHYIPIDLPGPRLPHDMCFSNKYSILNDFPLFWDPEKLKKGKMQPRYYPELGSRFGVLPRFGGTESVRWFKASPTFVLHFLNAYEEGDELIMDGYHQAEPFPDTEKQPHMDAQKETRLKHVTPDLVRMMTFVDLHAMKPRLWRWRFNLRTGNTSEECLDKEKRHVEFGVFNEAWRGKKYRYAYSVLSDPGWFLFTGIVKHDLMTGESQTIVFGEGRYISEAPFVPRIDAKDEDDGYLVSFVTDMTLNRSECVFIDCKNFDQGIVCSVLLPHRIPSGTHTYWMDMHGTKANM